MKKVILGMLLGSILLFPVGANAAEDSKTLTIDNSKVTVYIGDWKWITVNGNKYYAKGLDIQKGWLTILDHDTKVENGKVPPRYLYYFDETTGKMLTNVVVDGYIIGEDGKATKQENYDYSKLIYSGDIAKTIVPIDTTISTTTAAAQTIPKNEWKLVEGKWYYVYANGTMATGWLQVDGKWYYFNSDSSMVSNTVINGYTLDASGAWIS